MVIWYKKIHTVMGQIWFEYSREENINRKAEDQGWKLGECLNLHGASVSKKQSKTQNKSEAPVKTEREIKVRQKIDEIKELEMLSD